MSTEHLNINDSSELHSDRETPASSEPYTLVLESLLDAVWETDKTGRPIGDSDTWRTYTGQKADEWQRKGWLTAVHPDDLEHAQQSWTVSLTTQVALAIELRFSRPDGGWRWTNLRAAPALNEHGVVEKWVGICIDIHDRKQLELRLIDAETRFQLYVNTSSDIFYKMSADWSEMRSLSGKNFLSSTDVPTLSWQIDYIPEEDRAYVQAKIEQAITTKSPFSLEHRVKRLDGTIGWTFSRAVPVLDNEGKIIEWFGTATDVTQHKRALEGLADNEQTLRSLVASAPFPIGVYEGREMRIKLANQAIIDVWGKGNDVVGKRYAELLPELENQHVYDQLDRVFTTGVPFHARNQRIELTINGKLKPFYFNYSFTPLYTSDGQVYGVLNTAAEVTDLILVKQALENSQQRLQAAVELAELATWSMDIPTRVFHYSKRFMEWLGLSEDKKELDELYLSVPEQYRQSVANAIEAVILPDSSGRYENEHPVVNRSTGQVRIIHVQALVFRDDDGQPKLLSGTAQDVTVQRKIQLALEGQVQQRTEELTQRNEELAFINEELAATNEELMAASEEIAAANTKLEEVNQNLIRSNRNLEQFAYIASHDLQEPLRKIQQFGDLLKSRYSSAGEEDVVYIDRMQVAASRMSALIRDLLAFSRISTNQVKTSPVSLGKLVSEVLDTLSIAIEESQATIQVDTLPVIPGDGLQLQQLFQNLIANGLKFRQADRPAFIEIKSQLVSRIDLPASINPERQVDMYCQIDVIDNGIGFDEKYTERIFQVFQRLHGKNEFAGTGVGLAICQKVAANHGGAITATSVPGVGSTFTVYLPM